MRKYADELRDFRIQYVLYAMKRCNGRIKLAAAESGLHRNTFTRILKQSGLNAKKARLMRERMAGK